MLEMKPVETFRKSASSRVGISSIMDTKYHRVNFCSIPFGKRQIIYLVVKMVMKKQNELAVIRRKNLSAACSGRTEQAELAQKYDCTPGYISNMITGRKDIGEKTARKIEECLGVPMYWLDSLHGADESDGDVVMYKKHENWPRIVGSARFGSDGNIMSIDSDSGFLEFRSNNGATAIRINGHELHPVIRDGWFLVINNSSEPVVGDYVLATMLDGRKMLKELLQVRDGNCLLMSINTGDRVTVAVSEIESLKSISAIVSPNMFRDIQ